MAVPEIQASGQDTEAFSNNESHPAQNMLPYELVNSPAQEVFRAVLPICQGYPEEVPKLVKSLAP